MQFVGILGSAGGVTTEILNFLGIVVYESQCDDLLIETN